MNRSSKAFLGLIAAGAIGGATALVIQNGMQGPPAYAAPSATAIPATTSLPAAVNGQTLPSLAPMLKNVMPAVVSVHSKQRVRVSPFGGDPFFRRMFPELSQERISESLGSGVIIDAKQGLILTNHHVIEGADEVSVTLADGRTMKAKFRGSDSDTDVAVMQIPAENLSALSLADSNSLQVGDFVVAVGNPFGIGQTVTSGIVSAVGRNNVPGIGFQNFIQTDASINPGNSGGALVNLNGQLVGINTASLNPRGSMAGNIGLGFAIPSNLATSVMKQLLSNNGVVRRGTLGIETQNVTDQLARGLKLSEVRGVVVTRIYPNSAAAEAAIQPGDVIVAANGQRIDRSEDLRNFQGLQALDERIKLDILRDGKPQSINTTMRELPRSLAGATLDPRLTGATFSELPEAMRRQGMNGVLIESVARGSRAQSNGLRAGDVVIATNVGGAISDLLSLRAALSEQATQVALRVMRGNQQGIVELR